MKETFYTSKPKSIFLQKFIAYYYFHKSEENNYCSKFTYYPHVKNALSIYKNSIILLISDYHTKTIPHSTNYFFTYTKLTHQFARAELQAPFDKIGIVFQPLGLNHFVNDNLSDIITTTFNIDFKVFKESITPYLDSIYSVKNLDDKIEYLDEYFNSIYSGFQEKRLEKALLLLDKKEIKYSVQSLAKELNISRKTLLRLFRKHMSCSVKDYLSVVYFRRALEIYNKSTDKNLLTNIAFESNYYDQSEFINHFKKMTGINPKKFFKKLVHYGREGTFWSTEKNQ